MERKKFETTCLLTVLSSVISQKKPPDPIRRVDWDYVYQMANLHHVANVAYYGVMGLGKKVPDQCREGFFDKYKQAVLQAERMSQMEQLLMEKLEKEEIHAALLTGSITTRCYPMPEMRYSDSIAFLVEPGSNEGIGRIMRDLDYDKKVRLPYGCVYYKSPGLQMEFYEELPFVCKSMTKHFQNQLSRLPYLDEWDYIHRFEPDDYYIYSMCRLAEAFVQRNLELRGVLDLWVYMRRYAARLHWETIDRIMEKRKVGPFAKQLEALLYTWFWGEVAEDYQVTDAMEAYILTFGEEGEEVCRQLLPLIREFHYIQGKARAKAWFSKKKEQVKASVQVLIRTAGIAAKAFAQMSGRLWHLVKRTLARRLDRLGTRGRAVAKRMGLETGWEQIQVIRRQQQLEGENPGEGVDMEGVEQDSEKKVGPPTGEEDQ